MSAGKLIPGLIRQHPCREWPALAMLVLSMLHLTLIGCASWQLPAEFDVSVLRARAETQTVKDVKLSAAVLSSIDSQQMFGVDINKTGVQPVWIEVENNTNQTLWLLRPGTDPDLFSPLEVAWSFHASFDSETNAILDDHFNALSFQNPITPGTVQSGIIFTNPDLITKLLSIDILGQGQFFPFTLFPLVPDSETDRSTTYNKMQRLIETAEVDYQDANRFRARLEQLACCARDENGNEAGDPLNVILVGDFTDIVTAFGRRGYRLDIQDFDNMQHLFGRPPDIVARKTGQYGAPANWIRAWVAPLRYQGQTVLLAQAGRPVGGRFLDVEENDLVLNPTVDEVRNLLIQDILYSGGLGKLAFVSGVGATNPGETRHSLDGARYYTDGLRAVLFLVTRPLSLSDLEILDWHPYIKLREADAARENDNDEN